MPNFEKKPEVPQKNEQEKGTKKTNTVKEVLVRGLTTPEQAWRDTSEVALLTIEAANFVNAKLDFAKEKGINVNEISINEFKEVLASQLDAQHAMDRISYRLDKIFEKAGIKTNIDDLKKRIRQQIEKE
jgi:hypothetical protein